MKEKKNGKERGEIKTTGLSFTKDHSLLGCHHVCASQKFKDGLCVEPIAYEEGVVIC